MTQWDKIKKWAEDQGITTDKVAEYELWCTAKYFQELPIRKLVEELRGLHTPQDEDLEDYFNQLDDSDLEAYQGAMKDFLKENDI